jgi:ribosomal protein L12E/L44/L45/RPP1/RPP2
VEIAKGKTRDEIITRVAERIDSFEKYSHPHSRVMAELSARLARRMGLIQADINAIAEAASLHDIGLYAMNPAYHSSPGPLKFEERMDLWRHPIIGEQQMAKRDASRQSQLLVRWHHEWWNGTGYPDMLAFEDIPIGARILRAVELYSALTSDRPYRAAIEDGQAVEALKSSAGIECDPYVVKALIALLEDLRAEPVLAEAPPPAAEQTLLQQAEFSPEPQPVAAAQVAPETPLQAIESRDYSQETTAGGDDPATAQPPVEAQRPEQPQAEARQPQISLVPPPALPARPSACVDELLARARSKGLATEDSPDLRGWSGSRYNRKSLLGFEASVLRQIEFHSVAIPLSGWARLDWYLKAWGKLILSNDPRAWAAAASRAMVESRAPLTEDQISELLRDVYIPGSRLTNPHIRRWFGETDSWWMDNLRRNLDAIEDQTLRAQAIMLGLQTGDYALSFNEETLDLRRPLTTVFWRLAGRAFGGPPGHPHNRSYNQPIEEFVRQARTDLLYLNLPPAHSELYGSEARTEWREAWARRSDGRGPADLVKLTTAPQSRHTYLAMIDRLLRASAHIKTWAIEYQEVGLAFASDVSEIIKDHRPVQTTYSKDLTEVAGGLRNYIIVAERV